MLQPFTEGKAIIQVVLPPSWVTRINQLAREQGMNRSALIRAAIRAAYFPSESAGAVAVDPSHAEAIGPTPTRVSGESEPQRARRAHRRTPQC